MGKQKQKQDAALKFQSCLLKVNIHCDGCEHKVRKLLQKIDGVYSVSIDAESGKVLVAGNVDPARLIKKLKSSGKHAEIWGGAQRGVNMFNQNDPLTNQFKNFQIDHRSQLGKHNDFHHKNAGKNMQQKPQISNFHNKGPKDLMVPSKNHKSVKFNLPEDDFGPSDDDFDEFDDDDDFDDDFDDDDDDDQEEDEQFGHGHGHPMMMPNKKMNMMGGNGMGNGRGPYGPGGMMNGPGGMMNGPGGMMMNGPAMNSHKGGKGGGGGVMNAKKGDVIDLPIQMKGKNGTKEMRNGKKEKEKNNKKKKNRKSSKGGGFLGRFLGFGKKKAAADNTPKFKKNGVPIVNNSNNNNNNNKGKEGGGKKGGHDFKKLNHHADFDDFDIPIKANKTGKGGNGMGKMGQMGPPTMGQRGGQMEQMRNIPAAVQGLPAATGGTNNGYYQGMQMQTPHGLSYNQQQQYMAMMLNQQQQQQQRQQQQANMMNNNMMYPSHMNMMYGRPQGPMSYMPPPPMPSHPMADPITHVFSDENTESCAIM